MSVVHVLPLNDLVGHEETGGALCDCACGPDVEFLIGGGVLVTHHSLDGRERFEGDPSGVEAFVHQWRIIWWGGKPWKWRVRLVWRSKHGPFGELLFGPVGISWPTSWTWKVRRDAPSGSKEANRA